MFFYYMVAMGTVESGNINISYKTYNLRQLSNIEPIYISTDIYSNRKMLVEFNNEKIYKAIFGLMYYFST